MIYKVFLKNIDVYFHIGYAVEINFRALKKPLSGHCKIREGMWKRKILILMEEIFVCQDQNLISLVSSTLE